MKLRKLGVFFMLMVAWLVAHGQPTTAIKLNQLETAPQVSGRRDGQIGLSGTSGKQAYANYVEVNLSPIAYTPATSGNTSNLSQFVEDPSGDWWYIDWQGNAHQFLAGSGGNGIYGGDGTLPSPGGSDVTVPDASPLSFFVDGASGETNDVLRLNTDYNSDDGVTNYITLKSPSDSLKINAFGGGTRINHYGSNADEGLQITSTAMISLGADSLILLNPTTTTRLANIATQRTYLMLDTVNGKLLRVRGLPLQHLQQGGATTGQVLAWNGTQYAPATVSVPSTQYLETTGSQSFATTTFADVTGLSGTVTSGKKYMVTANITYNTSAATVGIGLSLITPNDAFVNYIVPQSATAVRYMGGYSATSSNVSPNAPSTTGNTARIEATINCTVTGTLKLQVAAETTGTITTLSNSNLIIQEL